MKFLAWLLLIFLVIWAIRSSARRNSMRSHKAATQRLDEPELMVQCAHCGVHFPASETISQSDLSFCSEEHRQLHFQS
ncbi:MAG: PP0621 family protein [Burkholderiaceae bacterium]